MIFALLDVIAPVAVIVMAGFIAVKLGAISYETTRLLMKFAQNFAVPLLLFNGMMRIDLSNLYRADILLSYFIPMLIIFILGFLAAIFNGRSQDRAVVIGFNAYFANSLVLALPLAERAFGADSLWVNFTVLSIHSPFGYIFGTLAMEIAKKQSSTPLRFIQNMLRELSRNPLIIGILAGLTVNIFNINLPEFLQEAIKMQSGAALPVALFALGGVLTALNLAGDKKMIVAISVLRLWLHGILILVFAHFIFHLEREIVMSLVFIGTMPTGTNGYIFASLYEREEKTSAAIVFYTTIFSLFTIPIWLAFLT